MTNLDLSTSDISCTVDVSKGLATGHVAMSPESPSWSGKASPEFVLVCDGVVRTSLDPDFAYVSHETRESERGSVERVIRLRNESLGITVDHHIRTFPGTTVFEKWTVVTNTSDKPVTVTRIDPLCLALPPDEFTLRYFNSGWGVEFQPVIQPLAGEVILQSTSGRSSSQVHPWFALESKRLGTMISTFAWSGNWACRFEPQQDGTFLISGGINPWKFSHILQPGESLESLHVITALGQPGDIDNAAVQLQRWGRRYWYPENSLARDCPTMWNHWWAYEDAHINSEVFKRNVDAAAELGIEYCVLDAGWFGSPDGGDWVATRGDWDIINTRRFPDGVGDIAEYTRSKGLEFGIWYEIESVGPNAKLCRERPDFVQTRDGKSLGAICFGNPEAYKWARETLERIVTDYGAKWIKLDYNTDVWAGCSDASHGHQPGDGHYQHIQAYYRLLDEIRAKHPGVIIENCASGGMRIDLGLMKHQDLVYLSDPDMPVHSLQIFWGATMMLAPDACLHWIWSDSRGCFNPLKLTAPVDADRLRYYCRISMLNIFGVSHPLPDVHESNVAILKEQISFYKQVIRPFVQHADLYHLNEQPRRDYHRGRIVAFQYLMPDRQEGMAMIFRTPGLLNEPGFALKGLIPDRKYKLTWHDENLEPFQATGSELMRNELDLPPLEEEQSAILFLE